ncbi:MAG TPA: hypothetical protein VFS66_02660 [Acidimicrobiia bacterium]|nr:hypothetical protein [Acidimicrobiia bacterium]
MLGDSSDGSDDGTDSTTAAAACVRFTGDHSAHIDTGSLAADALSLSGETFLCADDVVVVGADDLDEIVAASQLAAALTSPLLFPEPRLASELGRLKPERVHVIGAVEVNAPDTADIVSHDTTSAVELTRETLGSAEDVALPAVPDASTIVATVDAIELGNQVAVPTEPTPSSSTTTPAEPSIDTSAVVLGLATPTDAASLWMVDASSPETILLAAAVGNSIGASVVAIDGTDILGYPEVSNALGGHDQSSVRYVGATPEASDWELAVLAKGLEVPGGGFHILPQDTQRRYVAFYGHPGTASLGVLGEQGPAETRARMEEFVDAYGADGAQVIPTYEIIASVASGSAGDDGDYSTEWPPETFDDWIEYAGANGMYVLLDLQPGREEFLSQAMLYEQHLMLPHVGLALDPEWRLKDDQVHLVQAGTVDAAEINQVVAWLGDLVRDNGLPQKLLLLHQFKTSMITNRDQIVLRPELQTIIQMDGDGTEPQKDATWSVLREGPDSERYAWGWKNFFDEDEPGPPSPENTMSKVPTPVLVSYQ